MGFHLCMLPQQKERVQLPFAKEFSIKVFPSRQKKGAAENGWLEDYPFFLGPSIFSGAFAVTFRKCRRLRQGNRLIQGRCGLQPIDMQQHRAKSRHHQGEDAVSSNWWASRFGRKRATSCASSKKHPWNEGCNPWKTLLQKSEPIKFNQVVSTQRNYPG